ncbi:type VII secretion protein EccB [Mycobacterium frederiksbergense]|uniref:Type VII secretion protein EccB n=1 Tax=Mycolicibacterium frederiksbergense TaxID=117567 RepID=A0ABT6L4C7_9MYCO|nr:type VII secretion protein EccB [Mycolicibacterium frederiksbergense]MDH6197763.1 type VII secretion protein EccB [Mycolicibacterium frederiksbergense]
MARQPATRLQLGGHRFLLRRLAHALVRGDARMLDDPLRAQAIAFGAGCVLAVIAMAGCAVLALVRPGAAPGGASILLVRDSGALYVRIADVVHPVPNLASARLIVGAPANPVVVSAAALAGVRRGPLVGIPGAPAQIGHPLGIDESDWAICEVAEPAETVLLAGRQDRGMTPLHSGQALLVSSRAAMSATYLLADGWRARVDLRDIAVVRALRLEGIAPQPVSQALLDSVPEAPDLRAPQIAGAGTPGPAALGGLTVGTVVRTGSAELSGDEFYVVLGDGLQRIGRVAADLIRFTVAQPGERPPVLPAAVLADVPVAASLTVARFPDRIAPRARAVVCARWDPQQPNSGTNTTVAMADSLPNAGLQLAQADGDGPNIDRVQFPTGRSALIQATGVTRGPAVAGPLYLMNDLGVLFGIHDGATAEQLGLTGTGLPAPWPMLAMLPRGPELNRDAASVVRDAVPGIRPPA